MKHFDPHLYVIVDPHFAKASRGKAALIKTIEGAIFGGATMLQLRDKQSSTSELIALASKMHEITRKARTPFIINDRVDVALAIDADGVHLGQSDMPLPVARKILGKKKIIGASVKTVVLAKKAEHDGADYLGVGPIFKTRSKRDAGEPIDLYALRSITSAVDIPVVGIGGINLENAADVIKAGAVGIAVISAVMGARDPEEATRELLDRIRKQEG